MNIDLTGKTALVTGSTIGIGFAVARGLAASGATVIINGRRADSVDAAVSQLRTQLPQATVQGAVADLSSAKGCQPLLDAVRDVDILINNVGIYGPQDFFETPDDEWDRFFQTNVMSGVRLARAYLPGMATRRWGRVVFISSESALNIPVDMIHYGFTKTAMLSISRGLAKRMAGTGVTVNAVLPGPTASEGVAEMLRETALATGQSIEVAGNEFVRTQRSSSVIQRMATSEEVANMVVYVSSLQASATTGAALRVDGGVVDTIA